MAHARYPRDHREGTVRIRSPHARERSGRAPGLPRAERRRRRSADGRAGRESRRDGSRLGVYRFEQILGRCHCSIACVTEPPVLTSAGLGDRRTGACRGEVYPASAVDGHVIRPESPVAAGVSGLCAACACVPTPGRGAGGAQAGRRVVILCGALCEDGYRSSAAKNRCTTSTASARSSAASASGSTSSACSAYPIGPLSFVFT
jgi:hypothetical protein